jgi:5-methyltetrahydrofolate--homocysteine methyltransferase
VRLHRQHPAGYTRITIVVIIITLLGLLTKTGLKLGAVEAISVQIVVGMSVDYLLHLDHSYTTSSFYSRFGRSRHAFLEIGAPVVSASATTAVSNFVLMFTTVQVLATVGKIIFFMTVVAILESLFLFIPLLMWLGPTGPKTVEDPEYKSPHRL